MITVGFWCDECRQKYVQHLCKHRRLPCGHDYEAAIYVWCQAFGRGGEHVEMAGAGLGSVNVWLRERPRRRDVWYSDWEARFLWNTEVQHAWTADGEGQLVGEWLACYPSNFVRAFFARWESSKERPVWMQFRDHPQAKRACAIAVPERMRWIAFFTAQLDCKTLLENSGELIRNSQK